MMSFKDRNVEEVYASYPLEVRGKLLEIRQLVFDTYQELGYQDQLVENLKWNQPTYTAKKGSPIRLAPFEENKIGVFFHCQTRLVEMFREIFGEELLFSKNRAIIVDPSENLPISQLKICIQMALTYHQKK